MHGAGWRKVYFARATRLFGECFFWCGAIFALNLVEFRTSVAAGRSSRLESTSDGLETRALLF